jgi:hypothetical protein
MKNLDRLSPLMEKHRLASIDSGLERLRRWADWLIYTSVVLGIMLLAQLYTLSVPSFLFFSILAGWILYLIVAIAIWTGHTKAYPAALVLAIVTLAVSLPQPEHLSLAEAGPTLASLTFILGSILQAGVIILIGYSMIATRKRPNTKLSLTSS